MLYFFLRRVRTTLIVAVAIPFSLLVTCGAMFVLGTEFNVLTMLGLMLGVGMLVDNAVVVIENIYRCKGRASAPGQAARLGRPAGRAGGAGRDRHDDHRLVLAVRLRAGHDGRSTSARWRSIICLAVGCSLLISLTFIPLAAARFAPQPELKPGLLHPHAGAALPRGCWAGPCATAS